MTPDACYGQGPGRQHRDAPTRDGGRGLTEIGCLGLPAPTADGDADGSSTLGRELQAARGGHRQSGYLGNDTAQPAMA